jgi:hypothetical protein
MLPHEPVNKWHEGLLKLFGVIDPLYWTILWAMATNADEKGRVIMKDTELADVLVRDEETLKNVRKEMYRLHLVRIIRKRRMHRMEKGQPYREKHPRMFALYAGIEFGKVPEEALHLRGLLPRKFERGENVKSQTHRLYRRKFKPKMKNTQPNFSGLTEMEYRRLTPSASAQRRYARERDKMNYEKRKKWLLTMSKRRYFM